MRIPDRPARIRPMIDARVKKVQAMSGPALAATLSRVAKTCAKPGCRCHSTGQKHVAHQLTLKEQGKTRTAHVPKDLLPQVRSWIKEHKRLKRLLQEVSQLTLALVRKDR